MDRSYAGCRTAACGVDDSDLQGRLKTMTTAGEVQDLDDDTSADDRAVEVTEYAYNPDGIRISAERTQWYVYNYGQSGTEQWAKQSSNTTIYLIDAYNHAGYAQVFK